MTSLPPSTAKSIANPTAIRRICNTEQLLKKASGHPTLDRAFTFDREAMNQKRDPFDFFVTFDTFNPWDGLQARQSIPPSDRFDTFATLDTAWFVADAASVRIHRR